MKGLKRLNRKKEKIPVRYSMSEIQRMADESGQPVLVRKVSRPRYRRKTITIEPMSYDQAKERVSEYMKEKGTVWVSELHNKLHIDLGTLSEVIGKLREEGRIEDVGE